MTCNHIYNEEEPEPRQCFECGRPQNLVDAIQRFINTMDNDLERPIGHLLLDARELLEFCLEDLDPAKEKKSD